MATTTSYPNCGCCGGGGGTSGDLCLTFPTTPANNSCSNCSAFQNILLVKLSSTSWEARITTCGDEFLFALDKSTGGTSYSLTIGGPFGTSLGFGYSSSWDEVSEVTFTQSFSDLGSACNWPATAKIKGGPCGETTSCCPGVSIPNTIVATFSDTSGGFTCLPASVEYEWNSAGYWEPTSSLCCGIGTDLRLKCLDDGPEASPRYRWYLESTAINGQSLSSGNCSPFSLSFYCGSRLCAGGASGDLTVTFTE